MACILVSGTVLTAIPASAAARPPTAISLAKKLVKARICTGARITDPHETTAKCLHAPDFTITVHAYKTQSASRAALSADLTSTCLLVYGSVIASYGQTFDYRIGPTWWLGSYPKVPSIGKVLGGTLRTYDCPQT